MIFSAKALGEIVKAARPDKPISDMKLFGRDLDRAIRRYATANAMSPAQPWAEYWKRGEEYIYAANAFAVVHSRRDKPGQWWRQQLRRFPDVAKAMRSYEEFIRRLMAEQLSPDEQGIDFGKRRVRDILGPETALESLIGDLAEIYERHFGIDATASQSVTNPDKVSPFVAFALAVLDKARIRDEHRKRRGPIQSSTVIRHFRAVRPKRPKKVMPMPKK